MRTIYTPFIFIVVIMASVSVEASKFRLKNVPEQYALIEGAIVKKESQIIVIMTATGLTTRSLDSIEILEETLQADKEFIKTHGPTNQEYQKYIFPEKSNPKEETIEEKYTLGFKSIAKPGQKYLLQNKFQSKKLEYTVMDATFSIDMKDINNPDNFFQLSFLIRSVHSSYITQIDRNGSATMKIYNDELGLSFFVNNKKIRIPSWLLSKKEDTETIKINTHGDVEGSERAYDPESLFDSPSAFMQGTSRDLFFQLPDEPVAVGYTWKKPRLVIDEDSGAQSYTDIQSMFLDYVDMNSEPVAVLQSKLGLNDAELALDSFAADIENGPFGKANNIKAKQLKLEHDTLTYFSMSRNKSFYNFETITISGVLEGIDGDQKIVMDMSLHVEAQIKVQDQKPRKN